MQKKIKLSGAFLNEILQRAQLYEQHMQFNIENISRKLTNGLQNKTFPEHDVDEIIMFLVRAAKEFEITSETSLASGGDTLLKYFAQYLNNPISKDELFNSQIYYAFNQMPFHVLKYQNTKALAELEDNLAENIEEILSDKFQNKSNELDNLKNAVDGYIEQLEKVKQEFSFVGLNKAFYDLSMKKKWSKNIALSNMIFFGFLMLATPLTSEYIPANAQGIDGLFRIIPIIIAESILIYFFRIALHKYDSLTDQIVQLETKQAVIQFIESYVDYKKDKGLENEDTEKFDEIIFSKISPNLKDVPDHPSIVSMIEAFSKTIKK